MIILGIDPGIATVGVGVISYIGSKPKLLHYQAIITPPKKALSKRLKQISDDLIDIIQTYKPDCAAVEELFFSKNVKTAIAVAQGRGVAVVTAENHGLSVFDYAPTQIKSSVCGYGSAPKQQVQAMVKTLLNMTQIPKPDDAADALAIAICHAHSYKLRSQ